MEPQTPPPYQQPQPMPMAPPPPPVPQQATPSTKTDTMGIVSIILAFVGLQLIGLVVGLIGANKAKKEGRSPTLSRIGWILNLVFCVIALLIFVTVIAAVPSLQRNSRDTMKQNEMSMVSSDLENFYAKNSYYPATLSELETNTPNAPLYTYTPSPVGCIQCVSYVLETKLESGGQSTYKLESQK